MFAKFMTKKFSPYISLWFKLLLPIFWLLSFFTLLDKEVLGCLIPKGKDRPEPLVFFPIVIFFPLLFTEFHFFVCLCLFFKGTGSYSFQDHESGFRCWGLLQKANYCRLFSFITHDSHLGSWPYLGTWNQLSDSRIKLAMLYLFIHLFIFSPLFWPWATYRKQRLFKYLLSQSLQVSTLFIEICIYTLICWGVESLIFVFKV